MPRSDTLPPRSLVALWLGILGPPIIWLTQFEVKYALAGAGRAITHSPALIATSVVSVALIVLLGYVAGRERQMDDASPLDETAGVTSRNRFMATLGVLSSGLFLLLVVAQFIADFFFNPGPS